MFGSSADRVGTCWPEGRGSPVMCDRPLGICARRCDDLAIAHWGLVRTCQAGMRVVGSRNTTEVGALKKCYGFLTYLGVRPWPHFLVTQIGLS